MGARREPCGNCPFRKSAPLAHWHADEYRLLADIEAGEADPDMHRTFGCHKDRGLPKDEREMCVGWLLHQRDQGVPSIALRLRLLNNPSAMAQMKEATGEEDCYETIEELVRLNLEQDQRFKDVIARRIERSSKCRALPAQVDSTGDSNGN